MRSKGEFKKILEETYKVIEESKRLREESEKQIEKIYGKDYVKYNGDSGYSAVSKSSR